MAPEPAPQPPDETYRLRIVSVQYAGDDAAAARAIAEFLRLRRLTKAQRQVEIEQPDQP